MVENVYKHNVVDDTTERSQDEHHFMPNAENIQLKEGHYEIPLLFKNHVSLIPKNKSQALARVG